MHGCIFQVYFKWSSSELELLRMCCVEIVMQRTRGCAFSPRSHLDTNSVCGAKTLLEMNSEQWLLQNPTWIPLPGGLAHACDTLRREAGCDDSLLGSRRRQRPWCHLQDWVIKSCVFHLWCFSHSLNLSREEELAAKLRAALWRVPQGKRSGSENLKLANCTVS